MQIILSKDQAGWESLIPKGIGWGRLVSGFPVSPVGLILLIFLNPSWLRAQTQPNIPASPAIDDTASAQTLEDKMPEDVKVLTGKKVDEIVEPSTEYSYASFGRQDPFQIPEYSDQDKEAQAEYVLAVSRLQRHRISDLTPGAFWRMEDGEPRALIVTPDNEGESVKIGDPISSGKIIAIDEEKITARLYKIRSDGIREFEDMKLYFGRGDRFPKAVIRFQPGKDPEFIDQEKSRKTNNQDVGDAKKGSLSAGSENHAAESKSVQTKNANQAENRGDQQIGQMDGVTQDFSRKTNSEGLALPADQSTQQVTTPTKETKEAGATQASERSN